MTEPKSAKPKTETSKAPAKKTASKKAAPSAAKTEEALAGIKLVLDEMKKDRESRDKQLNQLFDGLDTAFSRADTINSEREGNSTQAINQLTQSIMRDHEATLKEVHEQEALADKKLGYLNKVQLQQSTRNKWIAIPGVILGIVAVIYMFYVVTVMEEAMTSMSKDMLQITASVKTMSQDTRALNVNMGHMSRDMNVMTRNVAPAMNGLRNVMPWAP
jgi:hypothetical protein